MNFRYLWTAFALAAAVTASASSETSPPVDPAVEMNRIKAESPGIDMAFLAMLEDVDDWQAEAKRIAEDASNPELAAFASTFLRALSPEGLSTLADQTRAREASAPLGEVELQTGASYKLLHREVPLSQMIEAFFSLVRGPVTYSEPTLRDEFLAELGIKTGSPHEAALLRAILDFQQVGPDTDETESRRRRLDELVSDPDEYFRVNREFYTADARRLGEAFGRFVAEVGGQESQVVVKVREYIDQAIRPGTSIASSNSFDDPEHYVWVYDRAFREGMSSTTSSQSPEE